MPLEGKEKRNYESERRDRVRKEINDIGEIPRCADPERRKYLESSPAEWLRTYIPERFFLPFSTSQLDFIDRAWNAITLKAPQNINAYRAFGKTSIESGLLAMTQCSGITNNYIYITAEGSAGKNTYRFFENLFFEPFPREGGFKKLICLDYPEICYPISIRDGVAQRPLQYRGYPCKIVISPNEYKFPNIYGSPTSGNIITFASILSGKIRGTFNDVPGRGSLRPDGVMLDDIQNDGSAKSESEIQTIMDIIVKAIDGVTGVDAGGEKIPLTIFSALTQNQPRDVAERIIEELPDWCTVIYRFLTSTPLDFAPWRAYREFRADVYRRYNQTPEQRTLARNKLVEYYEANRLQLESNCIADNPIIKEPWQVSAIHYALEKWCKSEEAFWCELQNDAARAKQETGGGLAPVIVIRKKRFNSLKTESRIPLKRFWIPDRTALMTAFIDCGEHYLNYQVTAFGSDYEFIHVVDFGVFPDQEFPVTSKSSFRRDIQEIYKKGDKFTRLRDAVIDCLRLIFEQQYFDSQGTPVGVHEETIYLQNAAGHGQERKFFRFLACCGVDCSDGEMELSLWDAVDRFHRLDDGRFFGRAIPCYGDEAGTRLLRYYDLKRGEWRRGKRDASTCDWIENPFRSASVASRYPNVYASLLYDSNTYKTARDAAWRTPVEKPGGESIFDWGEPEYLEMFAKHQCSEENVQSWKSNMLYCRWKMKRPRVSDNDFLDTDTGCRAMAHYAGIERETEKTKSSLKVRFIQ